MMDRIQTKPSSLRTFTLVIGSIYLALGLLGLLVPSLTYTGYDIPLNLRVVNRYGLLFNLFPVNLLHDFIYVAIGAWGLSVASSSLYSQYYARSLAVIFGLLAVMGMIPATNTAFGLVPLFGHDVWLHALTALSAAFFGWPQSVRHTPHTGTRAS